jgi:hypothetical protein
MLLETAGVPMQERDSMSLAKIACKSKSSELLRLFTKHP